MRAWHGSSLAHQLALPSAVLAVQQAALLPGPAGRVAGVHRKAARARDQQSPLQKP